MRQLKKKARKDLRTDPGNFRKAYPEAEMLALSDSLNKHGQHVPLITVDNQIIDGHRRYIAGGLCDPPIEFFDVIELDSRPTETELRLLQLSIDVHRTSLTPMERSDALARIMRENNWSVSELADKVTMKQPQVSKLLKYQNAGEDVRAALAAGHIDQDKAYTICQEPDHAKQRELLKQSGNLTRQQLRQTARSGGKTGEVKVAVARFMLPDRAIVTVQGSKLSLSAAIEYLVETTKQLKKAQADSLDLGTAIRVMADKSKSIH